MVRGGYMGADRHLGVHFFFGCVDDSLIDTELAINLESTKN